MCVVCQKLKAQIHASKDRILVAHFLIRSWSPWPIHIQVRPSSQQFRNPRLLEEHHSIPKLDASCPEDFQEHANLCSRLLTHYSDQYRDRMVYWTARERSANEGDMLTLIIDSFDRSKLALPMWPLGRTPKRTLYETVQRHSFFLLGWEF